MCGLHFGEIQYKPYERRQVSYVYALFDYHVQRHFLQVRFCRLLESKEMITFRFFALHNYAEIVWSRRPLRCYWGDERCTRIVHDDRRSYSRKQFTRKLICQCFLNIYEYIGQYAFVAAQFRVCAVFYVRHCLCVVTGKDSICGL